MIGLGLSIPQVAARGSRPAWLVPGPDGALPVQVSAWSDNAGYVGGQVYPSAVAYLAALSGTFGRGSDATYFDADGTLRIAGPNVLRLDHDPLTGKALGLRIEGQRTNYSARYSNLDLWQLQRVAISPNVLLAPNGLLEADKIIASSDSATHNAYANVNVPTIADNAVVAASMFLAAGEYKHGSVNAGNNNSDLWVRAGFNLETGEPATDYTNGTGASLVSKLYTPLKNGWGRYSTVANTGTQTPRNCITSVSIRDNAGAISFAGDGISGFYGWGAQLELGDFASSLIPNAGTGSATRLADALSYPVTPPTEYTLVVTGRSAPGREGFQTLLTLGDGSPDNRVMLYRSTGRMVAKAVYIAGIAIIDSPTAVALPDDTPVKIALAYKAGTYWISVNGSAAETFSAGRPTITTLLEGMRPGGTNQWFGTSARTEIYSKAYSALELPGMSAP